MLRTTPVLWWKTHRGNPRRCGSSYPWWLRSPLVQLCQGCQSEPPPRPAPLSSCSCRLWSAHSLQQTRRQERKERDRYTTKFTPQKPWWILARQLWFKLLTSSYMNWRVRADFPTPPLPTIITLWRAREFCPFGLAAAMALCAERSDRGRERAQGGGKDCEMKRGKISLDGSCNKELNDKSWGDRKEKREKIFTTCFIITSGALEPSSAVRMQSHHCVSKQ